MRKVYLLPNSFTAASMFCGTFACFEIYDGNPQHACWLIIAASVLDVMDGAIARLTRSASSFGLHFDSLADLVSFGVAPGMLAYTAFSPTYTMLASAVCSLFAVCAALRLARFNVQALREERKSFRGLPTPAAALAVVSLMWILLVNRGLSEAVPIEKILPPVLVVLAYLMVSKVPFYGLKSLPIVESQPFEILVTMVVIGCLIVMLKSHLDLLVFVVSWSYVLISVGFWLRNPLLGASPAAARKTGPTAPSPAPEDR
jgi:CDP-diacylglycerol---serine O-phosphatidyltransferase